MNCFEPSHSARIRWTFGLNLRWTFLRNRGGPHHSAIIVNIARIQPNSAEYTGFDPPDVGEVSHLGEGMHLGEVIHPDAMSSIQYVVLWQFKQWFLLTGSSTLTVQTRYSQVYPKTQVLTTEVHLSTYHSIRSSSGGIRIYFLWWLCLFSVFLAHTNLRQAQFSPQSVLAVAIQPMLLWTKGDYRRIQRIK